MNFYKISIDEKEIIKKDSLNQAFLVINYNKYLIQVKKLVYIEIY